MKSNYIVIVVVVVAVLIGAYLIWGTGPGDEMAEKDQPVSGETATIEIAPGLQKAVDFCKEKGGEIESVIAAEGVAHLCVIGDTKVEVSQYMADNSTD